MPLTHQGSHPEQQKKLMGTASPTFIWKKAVETVALVGVLLLF